MKRMFRYTVPVDGQVHVITLTGEPLAVAAGVTMDEVEFWAEHNENEGRSDWQFRVFGTGHPIPDGAVYIGTAPRNREGLVWHLYAMPEDTR